MKLTWLLCAFKYFLPFSASLTKIDKRHQITHKNLLKLLLKYGKRICEYFFITPAFVIIINNVNGTLFFAFQEGKY